MLLKMQMKDLMPVQDVIKSFQIYIDKEILMIASSLFNIDHYKLRDDKQFVGPIIWLTLSAAEKQEKLKAIGLHDTEFILNFNINPSSFPCFLAPNMSEAQRNKLMEESETFIVMQVPQEMHAYVVTKGSDIQKVYTGPMPVKCNCKFSGGIGLICSHILAVNKQNSELNLFEKMEKFIGEESEAARKRRLYNPTDGSKPATSSRRGTSHSFFSACRPKTQLYIK